MRQLVLASVVLLGSTARAGEDMFNMGAFGDVGATGTDQPNAPPSFMRGTFSLLLTSSPLPDFQLLAEPELEFATSEADPAVNLERLTVRWSRDDRLAVTLGLLRQPFGYYTPTFSNVQLLQTVAGRPLALLYEDEGGFLPIHGLGAEVAGEIRAGPVAWGYSLDIANGRPRDGKDAATTLDTGLAKSVLLLLYVNFRSLGLRLGGNALYDYVGADPGIHASFNERILGFHVLYERGPLFVLTEGYWVDHWGSDYVRTRNFAGFVEASYGIGSWHPYLRVDRLDTEPDAYFTETGAVSGDIWKQTVGVRYDFGSKVAVKGQYERTEGADGVAANGGTLQVAFGF
jgi:hypothetical protein